MSNEHMIIEMPQVVFVAYMWDKRYSTLEEYYGFQDWRKPCPLS